MLQKRITYPFVFLIIVLFYIIFITPNGYEEWDTGFISGMAWRIVNGEVMYRDFIYTKPPISPYYTSFLMSVLPEEGQFYYIRCINCITFALQICLTVFAINNIYNLKRFRINLWGFISIGFIISLLNYPLYPWYTPDGLFLAVVALYIKSKNRKNIFSLFLIALFAFLSALAKQSFYPVPLIFAVWIFIDFGLKKTLWFLAILAVLVSVFILIILQITTFSNFIDCITGQTQLHDVYYSCIYGYAHKNFKLYLIIIIAAILFGINYKSIKNTPFKNIFKWFIITQFITAIVLYIVGNAQLGSIIAFNSCVTACFYNLFILKRSFNYLYPAGALLALAWCSSVSWGYPYPTLFATAIIAVYIVLTDDFIPENIWSKKYILSIIICVVAFSYNWYPYRSGNFSELTYEMGDISPKLKYIKSSRENHNKFSELKLLIEKYGKTYITTTHYPGSHYLFNAKNPLSAGWMLNSEINYKLDKMLSEAAQSKGYIFLDNEYKPIFDAKELKRKQNSYFSQYIFDNCTPVEKTTYFTVYNTKELNEKLPEIIKNRTVY